MKVILKENDEAYAFLKGEIKGMVKTAMKEVLEEVGAKKERPHQKEEEKWCDTKRAMKILGVKSSKMQELRDNSPMNGIRISRTGKKYSYEVVSLYAYLEKNVIQ